MKLFAVSVIAIALSACSGASAPQQAAQADPRIQIGAVVAVSADHPKIDYSEMIAAANPANANDLIACSIGNDGEHGVPWNILFASHDGGATWAATSMPHTYEFHADPSCAFGADNEAWFLDATGNLTTGISQLGWLDIYKSSDAARTWSLNAHIVSEYDRPEIVADAGTDRYRGRAYAYAWSDILDRAHNLNEIGASEYLYAIAGDHVSQRVKMSGASKYASYALTAGEGIVTRDGTLVMPIGAFSNGPHAKPDQDWIRVSTSSDGGATISDMTYVADSIDCRRGGTLPSMDVDRSGGPFDGRIYIAWPNGDVVSHGVTTNRCSVDFAYSDDRGKTWSDSGAIIHENEDRSKGLGPDQYQPTVTVNKNGVVMLTWYDTREDPVNRVMKLRAAFSFDGGRSFTSSIPIPQGTMDYRYMSPYTFMSVGGGGGFPVNTMYGEKFATGKDLTFQFQRFFSDFPGHTRQSVADANGVFHPFWFSNMQSSANPAHETGLLTSAVHVQGRALRTGDATLEGMHDVTTQLSFQTTATNYDLAGGTATMTIRLLNNSKTAIAAPMKLRVLWMDSGFGTAQYIGPTINGVSGNGAVIDLSPVVAGTLAPSAEAHPLTLQFHLNTNANTNAKLPLSQSSGLDFAARVYAR